MKNFLSTYPVPAKLQNEVTDDIEVLNVNGHIHTPYSFSAFQNISEAFSIAKKENIHILGINDFSTTKGYGEFHDQAVKNKIFPLFNIEFMGLLQKEQVNNIRINDPSNPGRIYFCGKGLSYSRIEEEKNKKLIEVNTYSNEQTRQMLEIVNILLNNIDSPFILSFEEIQNKYSKGLVRERHLAKVLRIKIFEEFPQLEERKKFLNKLYSGKESSVENNKIIPLENEIRSMLLKKGGKAFVPESEKAFLALDEAIKIILEKKGIPCYPVLLDYNNGDFTEMEKDFKSLYNKLIENNVYAVELIPSRNEIKYLRDFVNFFWNKKFLVLFGTEHNNSEMVPLSISTKDSEIDETMKRISFESACVIAAHQYLNAIGKEGYINKNGKAKFEEMNNFISLGKRVLNKFFQN